MKNKKVLVRLVSLIFLTLVFLLPQLTLAETNIDNLTKTYGNSSTGTGTSSGSSGSGWNVSSVSGFGLPGGTLKGIIEGVLKFLLSAIGIVGVIGFAISGIMYLLSFGDDDRMKTAKQAMYYSITGVIVGLVGLVAIQAIDAMLNGSSVF